MSKTSKQKIRRMKPAGYRNLLQQVQIASIDLESCRLKVRREKFGGEMKIYIDEKTAYSIPDDDRAVLIASYDLIITGTTKKEYALKVK